MLIKQTIVALALLGVLIVVDPKLTLIVGFTLGSAYALIYIFIRKFIKKKSKKINVFCSGTIKKYLPGPIIQDLILDILQNK